MKFLIINRPKMELHFYPASRTTYKKRIEFFMNESSEESEPVALIFFHINFLGDQLTLMGKLLITSSLRLTKYK